MATRGFFPDYRIRADEPLTESEAAVWLALARVADSTADAHACACAARILGAAGGDPVTVGAFRALARESLAANLDAINDLDPSSSTPMLRGDAIVLLDHIARAQLSSGGGP